MKIIIPHAEDWKAKSIKLFKSELDKLEICLDKVNGDHRNYQVQRQKLKAEYHDGKGKFENTGNHMMMSLMEGVPSVLHYRVLHMCRALSVLEMQIKRLSAIQVILAFNKLSLEKRIISINQACLFFHLESTSVILEHFQCYDDACTYLRKCESDFPLLSLANQDGPVDNISNNTKRIEVLDEG